MSERTSHFASSAKQTIKKKDAVTRSITSGADSVESGISLNQLIPLIEEYLIDCEYRQHKPHTIANNRSFLSAFTRFLIENERTHCDKRDIKSFLHYLQQPTSSGGKGVKPITAKCYHRCLATFFKWGIEEEAWAINPIEKIKAPIVRGTLKEPLSLKQVELLIEAAKTSTNKHRDTAILFFLLDTGVRAAELCKLRMSDADFKNRSAKIRGKGDKIRMVYWGTGTAKALSRYLRNVSTEGDTPVFVGDRGLCSGEALTPSGLYQLMQRLGEKAGVKCGCHDWRRTFAVNILKNGANLISVQRLMGHETLSITQGYLNIAQTDIEQQHREFSPADRLGAK
jgi:site-specific recombinase XerD